MQLFRNAFQHQRVTSEIERHQIEIAKSVRQIPEMAIHVDGGSVARQRFNNEQFRVNLLNKWRLWKCLPALRGRAPEVSKKLYAPPVQSVKRAGATVTFEWVTELYAKLAAVSGQQQLCTDASRFEAKASMA